MKDNEINCFEYTCTLLPLGKGESFPRVSFHKTLSAPMPKRIIYSGRATIVIWDDGTKTVVKCSRHDDWSPDAGFLWALGERIYGSKARLIKAMKEHASYEYKK